ncbi:MAG: OmpH family outer membrane protein [Candidatus Coatesbacteria bacterium]|nr:OmpH family outer membrane protein [Candidatus Coatesbacteria bacterium]
MMIHLRRAISVLLFSLLALGIVIAFAASDEGKSADAERQQVIATVDLKAILTNSIPGKAAQLKLRDSVAEAKAAVELQTAALQRMEREMSSPEFTSLPDADKRKQQRDFEKRKMELSFLVEDTEKRLQASQDAMLQKMTQDIKGIIEGIARSKGYDFVLIDTPPSMVYTSGLIDATGDVLEAFEREWLKKVPADSESESGGATK